MNKYRIHLAYAAIGTNNAAIMYEEVSAEGFRFKPDGMMVAFYTPDGEEFTWYSVYNIVKIELGAL
jgi:hypothetical protein